MQSQTNLHDAGQPVPEPHQNIQEMRQRIQGTVITPDDPGFEQARMAWNLVTDQHPAVIVIPDRPEDVVEAVRAARAAGMGVAVQTTGHGVVVPANDCMLILTHNLTGVEVDSENQTAWVGGGCKWQPVLEKAQECGLAPLLGSSPDVGAVGYTLGGGLGWLARKYGLCADSARAFQVVTADGELIYASPEEHPDLFWALRGGGKGLGVVTAMQIQLFPVSMVYAGNLYYPPSLANEIFTRFRRWTAEAPDELTASVVLFNFPPIPVVPEFLRGKSFVMVRGCFSGDLHTGEALLRFWREWQEPIIDDFTARPFLDIARVSNDPLDPMPSSTTTAWLNNISDETADTLIRFGFPQDGPPPFVFLEVRHSGGAIARQGAQAGAFGSRQSPYLLECVGVTPFPQAVEQFGQVARSLRAALGEDASSYVYLNFLEGDAAWKNTRNGFLPETYARLQAVKTRYDPANVFRFGFNIQPAGDSQRRS